MRIFSVVPTNRGIVGILATLLLIHILSTVHNLHYIDNLIKEETYFHSDKVFSSHLSTATMANQMLRSKGVLLRYDERYVSSNRFKSLVYDLNGTDYMPATFVHASIQAPNVMFKGWPEEVGNNVDEEPRISYLIGSKFEPDVSKSNRDGQNMVHCRAYFPKDAHSIDRNHKIKDNPWGTSCTRYQEMNIQDVYNVTNK